MPYTATNWVMNVTPGNATNLNNLETQYNEAVSSFNPKLFTAFVISGLIGSKDGTVVNQLDVTAGTAFLLQADGTLRQRSLAASAVGQFTTATPSTTYFLDLNPDGSWSWGTAHSAVTNHITICSATTDASGNILAVTDARPLTTMLFSTMVGALDLPPITGALSLDGGAITTNGAGKIAFNTVLGSANQLTDFQQGFGLYSDNAGGTFTGGTTRLWLAASTTGAQTQEMHFGPRSTTALAGVRFLTAGAIFDATSATTPGTFVVKGGMKTSLDANTITTNGTGSITAVAFVGTLAQAAAANGLTAQDSGTSIDLKPNGGANTRGMTLQYRDGTGTPHIVISISTTGTVGLDNSAITTDGSGNLTKLGNVTFSGAPILASLQSGAASGLTFRSWSGTAAVTPFSVGGQFNSALSYIDNSGNLVAGNFTSTGAPIIASLQSGAASGLTFRSWSGSAAVTPFSVGGQFNTALAWVDNSGFFNGPAGGGIPTTRNGAATSVPIFTGSTTPTTPPTGSIWFNV